MSEHVIIHQGEAPTCRQCGKVIEEPVRDGIAVDVPYDVTCPHCGRVAMRLVNLGPDLAQEITP